MTGQPQRGRRNSKGTFLGSFIDSQCQRSDLGWLAGLY